MNTNMLEERNDNWSEPVSMDDQLDDFREARRREEEAARHGGLRLLNKWLGAALLFFVAVGGGVWWIMAAESTSRSDLMTNQGIGQVSAHTISFTLTPSNAFTGTEAIVIDFPNEFAVGGTWTTADFTFTDGIARTVAAVAQGAGVSAVSCSGANNVGIAIDTTDRVFRVRPCDPSFSSASGAAITLQIDGEAPDGTLTNPAVLWVCLTMGKTS